MDFIKPAFLDTVNHYEQLGKHSEQYAALLTFAALDPGDTFTVAQLSIAIRALPENGLGKSVQVLVKALEGADDKREEYWKHRVLPFWEKMWPKFNAQTSAANSASLALLCIAAGGEFPAALVAVESWLRHVQHPDYVIHRLHRSGLAGKFPEEALRLLFAILGKEPLWISSKLRECLSAIEQAAPELLQDYRYRSLDELARKFGL
jgi:hypothetical protein